MIYKVRLPLTLTNAAFDILSGRVYEIALSSFATAGMLLLAGHPC